MNNNLKSFTMAEILLSLTIIGVVAAITLPSLTGNINERTWDTKRKALYSRMSQAIALMGNLNGYGIGATEEQTASNAAKAFITEGLAKVYKINNICDNENWDKCGFTSKVTKAGINSKIDYPKNLNELNSYFNVNNEIVAYSQINTNAAAFETQNGESVIAYYNPFCNYSLVTNPVANHSFKIFQPTMCANFIYDLNGKSGPNKVGQDVGFMTVFYPTDSQVAAAKPLGSVSASSSELYGVSAANAYCRQNYGDEAKMANIDELKSIFINNNLGQYNSTRPTFLRADTYVSSTPYPDSDKIYTLGGASGSLSQQTFFNTAYLNRNIYCVK